MPLEDTHKAVRDLVEEYGADERLAEGFVEIVQRASEKSVSQTQLEARMRRQTITIILANAAVTAALLALFGAI